MPYSELVIAEIVSLSGYESRAPALLDEEEQPVIPGSGGFRKARWAQQGTGKRGGVRVVYYFLAEPGRVYLAAIYAKSRQETLSAADQNVLAKLAAQIKKAAKGGR